MESNLFGRTHASTSQTSDNGSTQSQTQWRQKRYLIAPYSVADIDSLTWEEFVAMRKTSTITIDTETTGLKVRTHAVIMLQLAFVGKFSVAIDARYLSREQWEYIDTLLAGAQLIIGANLTFDYNMLKKYRVLLRPTNVYDVLDVDNMLNLGLWVDTQDSKPAQRYFIKHKFGRFSLAGLAFEHLNYEMPKGIRKVFTTKRMEDFTYDEIFYGLDDVDILFPLYKKLRIDAFKKGFTKEFVIEGKKFDDQTFCSEYVLASADLEYNGIDFNVEIWRKNIPYFIAQANKLLDEIYEQVISDGIAVQPTLFTPRVNVNWASSKQVQVFFAKNYGIFLVDKHGKPAADKTALEKLDLPIAKKILKFRQAVKAISTYGEQFVQKYVDNNRLYTRYTRMVSTYRVASKSPNLQNIPREASFRAAFTTPTDLFYHRTADYPQQEPHITGDQCNSSQIKDLYLNGSGDMHSLIASNILTVIHGEPIRVPPKEKEPEAFEKHPYKAFRQIGKMIGLRMNYGGGPAGLADMFKIPLQEAARFQEAYFISFPEIAERFKILKAFALKHGYILLYKDSSVRRYFSEYPKYVKLLNKKKRTNMENRAMNALKASIERQAINTPTQGTAAFMTKAAAVIERIFLIQKGHLPFADAKIAAVLAVHDEKVQRIQKDYLDDTSLKYAMETAALLYCPSIPMKVETVTLRNWAH